MYNIRIDTVLIDDIHVCWSWDLLTFSWNSQTVSWACFQINTHPIIALSSISEQECRSWNVVITQIDKDKNFIKLVGVFVYREGLWKKCVGLFFSRAKSLPLFKCLYKDTKFKVFLIFCHGRHFSKQIMHNYILIMRSVCVSFKFPLPAWSIQIFVSPTCGHNKPE